jgi:hypothetical protein
VVVGPYMPRGNLIHGCYFWGVRGFLGIFSSTVTFKVLFAYEVHRHGWMKSVWPKDLLLLLFSLGSRSLATKP